ncbi:MAG TPA: N,N-dimethylformamidase beta subunit family domain-containing protein [Dongiaceae bacterium]|nr:N,N-dimethylformamidase beta subunit family domain-containing protein [Dongiaceae bacterium]
MLKIVGYADRFSVRPGEKIAFKVSCEDGAPAYQAKLRRLICGDDRPDGPGFKAEEIDADCAGTYPGRRQRIVTGSCIHVPADRLPHGAEDITLAVLLRATRPATGHCQSIFSRQTTTQDGALGFDLRLDGAGRPQLSIAGDTGQQILTLPSPLTTNDWYLLSASLPKAGGDLLLQVKQLQSRPFGPQLEIAHETARTRLTTRMTPPIMIAASLQEIETRRLVTTQAFDGKIEAPALYRGAASAQQLAALAHPFDLDLPRLAHWDFSRDIGSRHVRDISGNRLDGAAVNLPTRAVTGHDWRGQTTCWRDQPELYGAIHFHSDDLYDAAWETDFTWTVPTGLRSGTYALHLVSGDTPEHEDHVPFFILPPRDTVTAPIAFLASTYTFLAYANSHHGWEDPLSEPAYGRLLELGPAELFLQQRRDFGVSLYDYHLDGSGACHSSARRPILNMRPKRAIWNFNADLHVIDWLEASGQAYDIITDDRIDAEGVELLNHYRCVITGSHPEYHTLPMITAFQDYLKSGGRLMYLGGNGFYWRVATHPDWPDAIEVRRGEAGTRCHEVPPGERYHAFDGAFGGLWRSQGLAPQHLVGVGFVAEGFDENSHYRRLPDSFDPRAAFIFDGISAEERIGDFGSLGGAAGYELDAADKKLGTPPHALVLARSVDHTVIYGLTPEELLFYYPGIDGLDSDRVRAEIVFFECDKGGAVFSTGSITWASALAHNNYDNNVARMTGNVLKRFIDPIAFPLAATGT